MNSKAGQRAAHFINALTLTLVSPNNEACRKQLAYLTSRNGGRQEERARPPLSKVQEI